MEAVKTMIQIKIFLCAYGQKQQWQLFMCRTDYPIVHLGSRPQKKCSPKEARGKPSQNIWLSSVYSYTEREKKQVGTLRKEGNICGIL
jgi:hypothetical protein